MDCFQCEINWYGYGARDPINVEESLFKTLSFLDQSALPSMEQQVWEYNYLIDFNLYIFNIMIIM